MTLSRRGIVPAVAALTATAVLDGGVAYAATQVTHSAAAPPLRAVRQP